MTIELGINDVLPEYRKLAQDESRMSRVTFEMLDPFVRAILVLYADIPSSDKSVKLYPLGHGSNFIRITIPQDEVVSSG